MSRTLLLRPGALGDLLLTAPALLALRTREGEAHITLAGHAAGVELLRQAGLVDVGIAQDDARLLGLFTSLGDTRRLTRSLGSFDFAVAWMADAEGIVAKNLARLCATKYIVAPSAPAQGSAVHVADYLAATLSPLGSEPLATAGLGRDSAGDQRSRTSYALRLADAAKSWADQLFRGRFPAGTPVVAVHPGSGSTRKNWSPRAFAATVDALAEEGVSVLLVAGPADEAQVAGVLSATRHSPLVFRELALPHLAAILARCDAYLGNDSGVTHLAGLAGAPVVALFGPTDPRIWGPLGNKVTILRWGGEQGDLRPEVVAATVMGVL